MDWFLYDNGLRHERVKLSDPGFISRVWQSQTFPKNEPKQRKLIFCVIVLFWL